jgi:archaeal flagellar protein FlaJ
MEKERKKHEKRMNELMNEIVQDEKNKLGEKSSEKNLEKRNDLLVKPIAKQENISELHKTEDKINQNPIKKIKKKYSEKMTTLRLFGYFLIGMMLLTIPYYFATKNAPNSFIIFSAAILIFSVYLAMRKRLKRYHEIKKMEEVFPDFISLMSSNLRAGMTIDRALILSARKEFAPLDKEIMQVGKDILTSREISEALYDMGERIGSDEIRKTIQLLISGIRSGGNLSVLLEQTSNNMRERGFVKKRAASNVLMYIIFIFFAVAIGAPLLFALSSILVQMMTSIFADVPMAETTTNLPFTISAINISLNFIIYFSTAFIVVSAILASLILGLVSSGNERDGLKYTVPLILIGLVVFFSSRMLLAKYFTNLFG